MARMPNWRHAEEVIVEEAARAILHLAGAGSGETFSVFAFTVDYCFGDVVMAVDTCDNNLLHAKRNEVQAIKTWESVFGRQDAWQSAAYYLHRHRISAHGRSVGEFRYPALRTLRFEEWESYFAKEEVCSQPNLMGHVVVLIHRVVGELVRRRSFELLTVSSPFYVGLEVSDELELEVLRILNWPAHEGPRV